MKRRARVRIEEFSEIDIWTEVSTYTVKDLKDYSVKDTSLSVNGQVTKLAPFDDTCLHCKKPGAYEAYNVKNEIWPYGPHDGCLHLKCLEVIIGRRIGIDDLSEATWNDMIKHVMSNSY